MFNILGKIAEQKILEAQKRGDFNDLPGRGEPLDLTEEFMVPEECRMAYKILKNAGCAPPELQIKNEIIQIEDMLASIKDEQEKGRPALLRKGRVQDQRGPERGPGQG